MRNKLAVIGSRTFLDYQLLSDNLSKLTPKLIISGGARGADSLAVRWAKENNIPYKEFLPDWDKFGRGAGIVRNKEIVTVADAVLAFWDGKSKGTLSSINIAKKQGKEVTIINF